MKYAIKYNRIIWGLDSDNSFFFFFFTFRINAFLKSFHAELQKVSLVVAQFLDMLFSENIHVIQNISKISIGYLKSWCDTCRTQSSNSRLTKMQPICKGERTTFTIQGKIIVASCCFFLLFSLSFFASSHSRITSVLRQETEIWPIIHVYKNHSRSGQYSQVKYFP